MQSLSFSGTLAPKHLFANFLLMWMMIFLATFIIALIAGSAKAKAEVILPISGLVKISAPAQITGFTKRSSPALVEKNCQSLLSPTPQIGNLSLAKGQTKVWNRRNAGSKGDLQIIDAIKAYRRCAQRVALDELVKN